MWRFILKRLLRGSISLVLFQLILFALVHAIPGDFSTIAGAFEGRFARLMLQRQFGLDLPLLEQFANWLKGFFTLDLGPSFMYWPSPVLDVLSSRAPGTLLLFLSAAVFAYLIGIWLGKMAAWNRGGIFEAGALLGSVSAYTSFAPWLGFVALTVFAWNLGWFPYQGLVNINVWFGAPVRIDWIMIRLVITGLLAAGAFQGISLIASRLERVRSRNFVRMGAVVLISAAIWVIWTWSGKAYLAVDLLRHLALPLGTVTVLSFGETMMIMRASMLETIQDDFVLAARAKGIPEHKIRDHHVARNAVLPVITRLMLSFPFVIIGSIAIERVFFWRAMGEVLFNAIDFQDIPLLLGILSFVGIITLIAHMTLDILYVALDPRLRVPARN
jgi:peptide/nickel transport system permease protein